MGFNFQNNGSMLEQVLNQRGLKHKFISTEGSIRTNIKIFDNSCREMTEINEAGSFVSASAVHKLLDEIDAFLEHTHILVMSGSIPPGVPTDIYQRLIRMAHRKEVKTVLDTAGEPLLPGLEEKPYLIKLNSQEFEQAFQLKDASPTERMEAARRIVVAGVPYLCISMGADGALLLDKEHTYRAKALPVELKGLSGAGDSMVAGMCYAIRKHLNTKEMLGYAMAAAAGSIRQEGTLLAKERDVRELLSQVEIEVIA